MGNRNELFYLQHHGILGMKWGVRRYQNRDGTLTAAGKKRYGRNVSRKISANVERRINNSVEDFEKKHSHLHDTDRSAYYKEWNKVEDRIWRDEMKTTGKRLNEVLDNFRTTAKSTKELDRLVGMRLDSASVRQAAKTGSDYIRRRYG